VWSAALIREARLRAGLTQQELADRSGRERSVIARWEQGAVAPSVDAFLEIIHACGFELPLELVPRHDATDERLRKNALLSPERRVQRALKTAAAANAFDPYRLLAALERRHAAYVVIGAFGRIIQGADETTDAIDITPSLRGNNLSRLDQALEDVDAQGVDGRELVLDEASLRTDSTVELRTAVGKLMIVTEPAGTRGGYDDLRRAATREPIGKGLRPAVASTADLARMLAALGREADKPKLVALRRLQALERSLGPDLGL
jgi:transcriptional regulator with XRE-family HTH domain